MNVYGKVTGLAMKKLDLGCTPFDAWKKASAEVFPHSEESRNKGCPRGAFLGLCHTGLVKGVRKGSAESSKNGDYAILAVELIEKDPTLASGSASSFWERLETGRSHNGQIDVVIALFIANRLAI